MKTLVLFFLVFSTSDPHMVNNEPLIMHFDMPAVQCEQAVLDSPHRSYHGPVGNLPGYSMVSYVWCEDQWPETMDAEIKARE